MAKSLNVLFISSEVYPFAKEGGIADVSFSLPLALRDLGHDVRIMMPKYGSISERKNKIHEINRLRDIPVPIGKGTEPATVKSSSIQNPRVKVQAYITTNEKYFNSKKGIYHEPDNWTLYRDNAERFIFFSRSVIETCTLLGWFPDIIHCNDWTTGLIPAYIKIMYPQKFKKTKVVFTIHNLGFQVDFPLSKFDLTGLPKSELNSFKHKNRFNFLKGGIKYADFVTTVSKTYAEDILKEKAYTNGLNALLKEKGKNFRGILNGVDNWVWNPEKDNTIAAKYEGDFAEYKYHNKVALINKFKLEFKPKVPLIGMVSRINEDKGIDLLVEAADDLFKLDIQLVLLGVGDAKLTQKLKAISKKYPAKFKMDASFNDDEAHLVEAGSDMFLITSKREPCGLNFIYSLLYGSVPIVRPTGGLMEMVEPFDEKKGEGNAIIYDKPTSESIVNAVKRAVALFKKKQIWEDLVYENMSMHDYSWKENVEEYDEIYREILKDS